MKKIKILNRIGLAAAMVVLVSSAPEAIAQSTGQGTTAGQGATYITVTLTDYARELKARMALNSTFTAPDAIDKKLTIEPWMVSPACFVGPGYGNRTTNDEREILGLRNLLDSLAIETDPPLLLEAWMYDQNHFPVKIKSNTEGHYAENQSK